jgi:hypothetical protein
VPDVFPVAINGRPYMIDRKSQQFVREFEPRVRDSSDDSTSPGEAAISTEGLWRRGQKSWHFGAGQFYADDAEAADYRFYKSKGVNPWVKGRLTLLNDTTLRFPSSATNLKMLEVDDYLYVTDGNFLRFSSTPFAAEKTATISTVSGNGTTMSYTTTAAHGFSAGDVVTITGVSPAGYNVTKGTIATIVSTTEFTVAGTESGAYVSGGSATSFPWKTVTGSPAEPINDIATDGKQVYVAYEDEGILMTDAGGASMADHYATSGGTYNYTALGFAKGFVIGVHNDTANTHVHVVPYEDDTSHGSATATIRDPNFVCAGIVGGQNHVYIAGRGNDVGLVYRMGIKDDGTLDVAVVALELPVGEYPTAIYSYLGSIVLGTNKGVPVCTSDSSGSLVSGALIPTGNDVLGFTAEDRFVWFTWSSYDGVSSGLGRLDLSRFIATNTPSFATDLMYTNNAQVQSVASLGGKRVFSISGVGVIAENPDALVPEGSIETGNFTWDIVDPKFSPRFDVRMTPLVGSISVAVALDNKNYEPIGVHSDAGDTEHAYLSSENNFIEAAYKITLTRATATTGPTFTRWMARAYAAPKRSKIITLPLILHEHMSIHGRDYYFDVVQEREELEALADNPRIVSYQEQGRNFSVIVENTQFQANFSSGDDWLWEGTMIVQMRTVAE